MLEPDESFEGVMVVAAEAVLVADEEVGMARGFGDGTQGEHGPGAGVFGLGGVGLVADFVFDGGGLDGPDAVELPLIDGHAFDQQVLGRIAGSEIGDEGVEEPGEFLRTFAAEDDGFRENTVPGGVAGGVALACGGNGAAGFLRVGAVGGETFF